MAKRGVSHHSSFLPLLGAVSNTNTAESKHKGSKITSSSSSGRDNQEHLWKCHNDQLALRACADGVQWTARDYVNGKWVIKKDCTAGSVTRIVLRDLFKVFPLSPAGLSDDAGLAEGAGGHPHGYKEWESCLQDDPAGVDTDQGTWQQRVSQTLPSCQHLEERYDELFGCGRLEGDEPCQDKPLCSFCWRNRGWGLVYRRVCCFSHWGQAPEAVSAGMGKILGGTVVDACRKPSSWMLDRPRGVNDIEIYVSADAARDGTTGVGHTTLAKVIYFFEHQGNDQRKGENEHPQPGIVTLWLACLEYVTAGTGHQRKVDPATGFDVFHLRSTLSFFPVQFIRRAVHIVHQCPTSGDSACGLVSEGGKRQVWQCKLGKGSSYLLNKYFHSIARDPLTY